MTALVVGLAILGAGALLEWVAGFWKDVRRSMAARRVRRLLDEESGHLDELDAGSVERVARAAQHLDHENPHTG